MISYEHVEPLLLGLSRQSRLASPNKPFSGLLLCLQISSLATIDAIKKTVKAEAYVLAAQAPVAIAITLATVFRKLALHAEVRLAHAGSLRRFDEPLSQARVMHAYFRNSSVPRNFDESR